MNFLQKLSQEMMTLRAALSFFTALPVYLWSPQGHGDSVSLSRAIKYFGVVGFVVAIAMAACYKVSLMLWGHDISCSLTMVGGFFLTRCLHEDGLADCADGFGGGWSREEILDLMKDPRHGTFGVIAIASMLLIKFLALRDAGSGGGVGSMTLVLVLSQVLSRVMAWGLTLTMCDARSAGAFTSKSQAVLRTSPSSQVIQGDRAHIRAALPCGVFINSMILLILGFLSPFYLLFSLAFAIPLFGAIALYLKHHLGGYTGDCLGASQQVFEVGILLVCAVLLP